MSMSDNYGLDDMFDGAYDGGIDNPIDQASAVIQQNSEIVLGVLVVLVIAVIVLLYLKYVDKEGFQNPSGANPTKMNALAMNAEDWQETSAGRGWNYTGSTCSKNKCSKVDDSQLSTLGVDPWSGYGNVVNFGNASRGTVEGMRGRRGKKEKYTDADFMKAMQHGV